MNDFNDSLWGEDDIDEALLIEASQQVEAETVSKAKRSNALQNRTDALRIDAAELETLIQNGENDRKETDSIVSKDCFPNSERFMQTQTVFQGLDAPKYKFTSSSRTNNHFYNSFNDTSFAKPTTVEKQRPQFPQRSSFDYEAKTSKQNIDIHPQSTTETQLPNLSNSSTRDIDSLVAELEKLKSENSELMSIKYSKNGEISVLREEIKKCEIKLNNERTERQKVFDKKSSEIEEIKAKVKMQLESMKSERDFISRELDLSKEALRKKDRKIKEIANGIVESPSKRLKFESNSFYSPGLKRKNMNGQIKIENGVIPQSIDRSLCDEIYKSECGTKSFNQTKDCSVQTVCRDKHQFILKKLVRENPTDSIERLNSELQKYYQASKDKHQNSQEILSKKLTTMSAAFVYLVPKIRDLVICDSTITQQNQLFRLLRITICDEELNQTQVNQLFSEIKFVQRTFIKIVEEAIGKAKNVTTTINSSDDMNGDKSEETKEPLKGYQAKIDGFLNFLTEALNLLEEGCEITSSHICTKNKGNPCFTYFLSLSVQRLFTWWKTRKKGHIMSNHLKCNSHNDISKLANALFSWLAANNKLIYKKGISLPWLLLPQPEHNSDLVKTSSKDNPPQIDANEISTRTLVAEECTNCRMDLIDILIYFLSEGIDYCTENQIQDLSHDMLLMASGCSIYLHKLWSSDAQKFASTVASNPRTQRKFVWSIAQMQRFPIPSQSLLIKVIEDLTVEVETF